LARFGSAFVLAHVLVVAAFRSSNLIVGHALGAEALGFFSQAFTLMLIPVGHFAQFATSVLFPVLSKLQSEPDRLRWSYYTGSAVIALGSGPLSALMIVTAPEIVHVLLGPGWSAAIVPLQVLSLGILFTNVCEMAYCLDGALGAMSKRAIRNAIYLVSTVVGSIIGLRFGLPGVATGVLAATVINFTAGAAMSLSLVNGSWYRYLKSQAPGLLLGALTYVIALPIRFAVESTGLPASLVLLVTVITSAAVLVGLLALYPKMIGRDGTAALRLLAPALSTKISPRMQAQITALFRRHTRRPPGTPDL
jgi:PST family polysaccharide transporter